MGGTSNGSQKKGGVPDEQWWKSEEGSGVQGRAEALDTLSLPSLNLEANTSKHKQAHSILNSSPCLPRGQMAAGVRLRLQELSSICLPAP